MRAVLVGALVLAAIVGFLLSYSEAAYCHGSPKPDAKPNMLPVYNKAPTFVKSVPNGKLFTINEGDDLMHVIHVYGTPYQMGFAHGTLVKEQLAKFMGELWNYILVQIEKSITFLPDWLQKIVAEKGVDFALDITYDITRMFTGSYFYEEMKGIADATGVDYKLLRRVHLIGELTKGACSMIGAWGDATPFAKTLQLRAFDWDTDGPYKNYPALIVYHPNQGNGHTFVNIGFLGWIGAFSGMSSQQMAISEIGVSYPDDTFGKESRIGIPFTYILRDILQFDKSLDESIHRIQTANRTCNLILGVGDAKAGTFRAFQYAHTHATVISDTNLLPANDTWHPKIKDVVYFGMDWLCPNYHQAMASHIKDYYGNITAETTMRYIVPLTTTGNLQVAIYDLSNNQLFVSYARKEGVKSDLVYAYERTYSQLDTIKLFAEPAPTAEELAKQ